MSFVAKEQSVGCFATFSWCRRPFAFLGKKLSKRFSDTVGSLAKSALKFRGVWWAAVWDPMKAAAADGSTNVGHES
jgi:hypothetical protein